MDGYAPRAREEIVRPQRLDRVSWWPLNLTVRRTQGTHLDTPARSYYSPWQIAVATLIGGPLAGGYLASRDHALFGAPGKGRAILIVSCIAVVGLIYLGSVLPDQTPRSPVALLVAIAYRSYASYAFDPAIAQRRSEGWLQYSWWRTLALSLAFLLAIVLLAVAAVFSLRLS